MEESYLKMEEEEEERDHDLSSSRRSDCCLAKRARVTSEGKSEFSRHLTINLNYKE